MTMWQAREQSQWLIDNFLITLLKRNSYSLISVVCEYEYKSFGQKVLKTDSKLLKIFCGISFSDMGFTYDVEDIYFICCVNPYMPPESRYIGDFKWEEDLDED